jgi:glycyl-tRNA synthetase beta chain
VDNKNFLFELGTEEIPAAYINNAVQKLEEGITQALKDNKLTYKELKVYSTPRRMALLINSLQSKQADEIIEKVGPAKKIAVDENGELTKPGMGFVKGAKASVEDVFFKETAKGEYIAVKTEIKGQTIEELLPEIIKAAITKINYPKSMRWGSEKTYFARPIRWILCLINNKVLDLEFAGVKTDRKSFGNRFYKQKEAVEINSPDEYLQKLRDHFVIADRDERKMMIRKQMEDLYQNNEESILEDERLLEQVTDLVEYPNAVIASFDKKYLSLPEKIISSTLSQNQKYFAVHDKNDKLSNNFVFISNGDPDHADIIRHGNEKVVQARLEDASFYYEEDTKNSLETYVDKLGEVLFQAQLGTVLEKTERIQEISKYICGELGIGEAEQTKVLRAAYLCKADLVCLMLGEKEFTRLQGYIGMHYALHSGEDKDVALAIYEHYSPRGQNDALPSNIISAIVAIADKIDTVCGIIGVDMIPTGSQDPFALRRSANGVVQIIEDHMMDIDLLALVDFVFGLLSAKLKEQNHNLQIVKDFMQQRMHWLMEQKGFAYDLIDSLSHIEWSNILDIKTRLADLKEFREKGDFIKLVLGFKRVSNIIEKDKTEKKVDKKYMEEQAEIDLYENHIVLKEKLSNYLQAKDYRGALAELLPFSQYIDKFFDDVLVNCEDEAVKTNRYALLKAIRLSFLDIADISKIVIENN